MKRSTVKQLSPLDAAFLGLDNSTMTGNITSILVLDPAVAGLVALNILWSGSRVVRESLSGLMDEAVSDETLDTVRGIIATEAGGDYGVTVLIDHVIDGQIVSTRYGHMQYGSLRVKQGDTVTAGQVLGTVGQTGKATGPHLHLEVLLGGTAHTDPIEWLKEHTNGTHTVG